MILNNIRERVLKEIFDAMEEAFNALNIDFYIIGAVARNVWYEKGQHPFRQTKGIDFQLW